MKSKFSTLMLVFAAAIGLWSCYPDGPDYYEDTDITFTQHDSEFDFASRQTYALPDRIVVDVEIENGDTSYVYMRDVYATPILQTIDAKMSEYGWTKVAISASPDVVLTPAAFKNTTYFYSYWYDWWWGGWYPGWGWYYPPYYTISSITTGSMVINMADPNVDNPVDRAPVAWMMIGNGLASGSNNVSRITDAINQAFEQSPYLKTN
ncbi:DUF4136 domain-containing protein [Algoriphagus aestuariicola]|jgi:hypothetical protein|uniref:DUF4136 domain-containing protein n=1 Tax=Algoriphagus aestuariicola TaxID=1852016 RepID=A0ABS3BQM8_9BACT|nr:DUF4136 domain-containing protein [Algoriphagus aestuariicola]MBN7801595.1 DUF4136 domain-containing protein [Algoriphagus aestuariicola]